MSGHVARPSHEEIVEMISRCSSVGGRRSRSSPQSSFVLPRSRSSTTVLLRSSSRTRPDPPARPDLPLEPENVKKETAHDTRLPTDGTSGSKKGKKMHPASIRRQPYLRLGSRELTNPKIWQSTLVEFAGTLVLTFVSIAAVIACLKAQFSFPRIAVAFTQFLIYTACILAAAPVSGGHLNPSFSFATMLTGHISLVRSMLYIVAQSAGSVIGACFVKLVVSSDLSRRYFLGGCLLKQEILGANEMIAFVGVDSGAALVAEVAFSFLLISVAFPLFLEYSNMSDLRDTRAVKGAFIIGVLLGLLIFVSGELLAPGYTSAGMNPARCFGPAIVQGGSALWSPQWVFWVGPLIAGVLFAILYRIAHWRRPARTDWHESEEAPSKQSIITPTITEPVVTAPSTTETTITVPSVQQQQPTGASLELAQPNSARRMDVFLHIKAMMHKAENEREGGSRAEEERDVEQGATSGAVAVESTVVDYQ